MRIRKKKIVFIALAALFALPVLYEIGYTCFWTHLSTLAVYRIGFYPFEETIPLKASGECPAGEPRTLSLSTKNGGRLSYFVEFFEAEKDLRIRGSGWTPSGKGILSSFYEISDDECKKRIIDFLLSRKALLLDSEKADSIRRFAAKHKDKLTRLGDGDPYVGLERAGVAEWIKAGKNPEAEWAKKYPRKPSGGTGD